PEPALRDIVHAAALGFFFDGMSRLALGADEENILAFTDSLLDQTLGKQEALHGLFHIDDVNHVALAVNVRLHLRVPTRTAVSEMHAGINEGLYEFCLRLSHVTDFDCSPMRNQRPGKPESPWGLKLITRL